MHIHHAPFSNLSITFSWLNGRDAPSVKSNFRNIIKYIMFLFRQEISYLQEVMSLKRVQSVSRQINHCDLDWTHPRGRHRTGEYLQTRYAGILNTMKISIMMMSKSWLKYSVGKDRLMSQDSILSFIVCVQNQIIPIIYSLNYGIRLL